MSQAVHIGGLNSSVSVAVDSLGIKEIELPKLPNGHYAKSYLIQQTPTANAISFMIGPSLAAFVFGEGPLTPENGAPLVIDTTPGATGTNAFVRATMSAGTATLVVTPLEG